MYNIPARLDEIISDVRETILSELQGGLSSILGRIIETFISTTQDITVILKSIQYQGGQGRFICDHSAKCPPFQVGTSASGNLRISDKKIPRAEVFAEKFDSIAKICIDY